MKKNKKRLFIILGSILLLAAIAVLVYIVYESNKYKYTYDEKKWMSDNANNIINLKVNGNLPVFSNEGNGVYNDLIEDLETDTNLSFNIIYSGASDYTLDNKNVLNKNDLLLYTDHYVVISNSKVKITKIDELKNYKVGVLSKNMSYVSYYLTEYPSISLTSFETLDDLENAFENSNINLAIVPMLENIDKVIENQLNIIYHFDGLKNYYSLSMNPSNSVFNSVLLKFLHRWDSKLDDKVNEHLLNIFYNIKDYTELQKESIINDDLIVGYVQNLPFEGKINGSFEGVTGAYLKKFANLTGATYKYIKYDDINGLLNAFSNSKVDLAMNTYNLNSGNYINSITLGTNEYVVLASKDSDLIVETIYGLKDKTIETLSNRNLRNKLYDANIFTIVEYPNIEVLLNKITADSIIIVEKEVYDYYKANKLEKYNIRYTSEITLNNTFLLNKNNSSLNELFNFFLTTVSTNEINTYALNQTIQSLSSSWIITFVTRNVLYIIVLLLVLSFVLFRVNKKVNTIKRIKKDDKLMYLDVMTNVKNRNYLNENLPLWEKNNIMPQTIIIVDLDNIRLLNDKEGFEAGDRQIKAAADVLIRSQRDKSEIIRTDGNEFTIYMIGYEEKIILSYIHRINKELKTSLPYKDFGASIGYKMIRSEAETIDDAINEAFIMMKKNKENQNEEESN